MIFMKNYALIAVASACFLLTSCTNDELDSQSLTTSTAVNQNEFNLREGDSISSDTNPVKTNGRD
jgi:outer membrane biogenesis lipoprotein LolB